MVLSLLVVPPMRPAAFACLDGRVTIALRAAAIDTLLVRILLRLSH